MRKEKNENNILDFKSTMEALIEEEKPEVTQEEAIRSYKGEDVFLKKKIKNHQMMKQILKRKNT